MFPISATLRFSIASHCLSFQPWVMFEYCFSTATLLAAFPLLKLAHFVYICLWSFASWLPVSTCNTFPCSSCRTQLPFVHFTFNSMHILPRGVPLHASKVSGFPLFNHQKPTSCVCLQRDMWWFLVLSTLQQCCASKRCKAGTEKLGMARGKWECLVHSSSSLSSTAP